MLAWGWKATPLMKVQFHYATSPDLQRKLTALSADGLDISWCDEGDEARIARLLPAIDVIWHCLKPITAAHIAAAGNLKLIQKIGVGVNTIDLDAAKAHGVQVSNMPGTNTRAVAEQTLLLMLAALRRLPTYDRATRAGAGWNMETGLQDRLGEIAGRSVGLVGYGAVGRMLTPTLAALGARVLYTALGRKDDAAAQWRTLDALLAEADIVSMHLPLTDRSARMIDAAAIARMKPGAVFVNTARGGLVDEAALVAALQSGHIRAAGLDVFAGEPVDPANPLLSLDNVVVMPHVTWLTPETLDRSFAVAVENCRRIAGGEAILHRVA